MDSAITQIIGTLLIIALAYLAQERKRKLKGEKEPPLAEQQQPRPTPMPHSGRRTQAATQQQQRSAYRRMHPDSQEVIYHSEVTGGAKRHTPTSSHENPIKSSQEEPKTPILEDFDARKAIVWSEIMTPKFDE